MKGQKIVVCDILGAKQSERKNCFVLKFIHASSCPSIFYHLVNIDSARQLLPLNLNGCSGAVERNERQSGLRRNKTGVVVVTLYILDALDLQSLLLTACACDCAKHMCASLLGHQHVIVNISSNLSPSFSLVV